MNIAIVEDQLMFREALRKACVQELGHAVVGETGSGTEAVKMILRTWPDVVLLDLSINDLNGFDVMTAVKAKAPALRFLVLSSYRDAFTLSRIEKAGVAGFIDKDTNTIEAVKHALVEIAQGRTYFSRTYRSTLAGRGPNAIKLLSGTEQKVLSLIGQGMSDGEIARRLDIVPSTAQSHRRNIGAKLGISGTPKLVAFAAQFGLTQLPHSPKK